MYQVLKRDGGTVEFEISKISAAMVKAFEALNKQYHPSVVNMLALQVSADFESKIKDGLIAVEDIQDSVEKVLSESGYADVAKAYILYRKQREKVRNINSALLNYKDLVDNYLKINDWRVKENSTVLEHPPRKVFAAHVKVDVVARNANYRSVKHRIDVVRPALERARIEPAPRKQREHPACYRSLAAVRSHRGKHDLKHCVPRR